MTDIGKLRTEFFNAQRALVSILFTANGQSNQAYVQIAFDRMNRAFNSLMLSTLKAFDPVAGETVTLPPQELLCAYAVNIGDDWNGSRWQVMFVNGEPVAAPTTVGEFTRHLTANGWRVFSPQAGCEPNTLQTPNGEPIYALYFCRDLPPKTEEPAAVTNLPKLQVGMTLSTN
jgi:hypothetical protein